MKNMKRYICSLLCFRIGLSPNFKTKRHIYNIEITEETIYHLENGRSFSRIKRYYIQSCTYSLDMIQKKLDVPMWELTEYVTQNLEHVFPQRKELVNTINLGRLGDYI